MISKRLSTVFITAFIALFISACGTTDIKSPIASSSIELYEVFDDGRVYVFYDRALYKEFMQVKETAYRLTKIGAGPSGMTLVYGLTKKDKKLKKKIPAIELYEGKNVPTDGFYAEMRRHGRIYVFNNWNDMKPVRETGHPIFFYTEIGSGPKGETVVYVLNKKTKKKRPDALIKKFKNNYKNS